MLATTLADLEHMNEGLLRGRMSGRDYILIVSSIDCTLGIKTYTDAFHRVLTAITEIHDAQRTTSEC